MNQRRPGLITTRSANDIYKRKISPGLRIRLVRKLVCLTLVLSFLLWPAPGLTAIQVPVLASAAWTITANSLLPVSHALKSLFGPSLPRKEKLADRLSQVNGIRISPERFVAYQGESMQFSALPTDYAGRTLQGVKFEWESLNDNQTSIDETGLATFSNPGQIKIRCRAGSAEALATVLVRPGKRPIQSDEEWRRDHIRGTREIRGSIQAPRFIASLMSKVMPTAYAQTCQSNLISDSAFDELWSDPANHIGAPRNRAMDPARLGGVLPESSNYNLAIPILNLGGRGIGTNLTLYYNSRVWSRKNNTVYYDALEGWPGPGFSLGFGRLVAYGSGKYMLIEPDGTRRYLGTGSGSGFTLRTTDGSNITYENLNQNGGTLRYQDGTRVGISNINNRLLPTSITDRNGNVILIAYKLPDESEAQYSPLAIDYMTDTLGRVIEFNYDSEGKLLSIDAPAIGGTSQNPLTRKLAQFEYQSLAITTNFSGLSAVAPPSYAPICVPKRISFPDTESGYLFTYSTYGMIYKFSLRKGVYWDQHPPGYNDTGERASITLNYPTTSATQLTNAPVFTQRTEAAAESQTAVYSYATTTDAVAQTKTFKVTRPDTSELWLVRSTDTTSPANGLLVQTEIRSGSTSLSKRVMSYTTDSGGSPQVQSVTSYDDAGVATRVDFDYDQYGNVTNEREYGHQISGGWQVRRRKRYTYKTDSAYINKYLRSLLTVTEVFDAQQNTNDGDDVLIAKASNTYDDYTAMGGMENYGYTSSNPWPPHHSPTYGTGNTVRGNVTGTTQWTDIAANTSITRLSKYDIFGNVVKAQVSCCQEKTFTRTEDTYWSQIEETMSGSPSGPNLTTSADFDFNTGATRSQTDHDNNMTEYTYDNALRMTGKAYATGATSTADFDDPSLSASMTSSYDDGGVMISLTGSTDYDGWGRTIRVVSADGAQVNTAYDAMGRVTSVTMPFAQGGTPGPATAYQYDLLGRQTVATLPDNNTIQTVYNGTSVTSIDQVNRKMEHESDGLGRLVSVKEQNGLGQLNQTTTYTYDLMDRLVEVNQGNQLRSYKYDGLGRLLFERIPEQNATINDGTGVLWSSKYTYTDFNSVATRTDARGVITTYSYDTLHRITGVSYNTTNAPGVIQTPSVAYVYSGAHLNSVTIGTGGNSTGLTESYVYDQFERQTLVRRTINGFWYDTNYQYNEGSQRKQLKYPSTRIVNLSYDTLGRLTALRNQLNVAYLNNLVYNLNGQVTQSTLGNGIVESSTYDAQRLQRTSQTATKSGNTLLSLNYSYQAQAGKTGALTTAGNADQLMSISGQIGGQTESAAYTYDNLGRLVSSAQTTNGTATERLFSYDRWGNRTGVWNSLQGTNQIQSISLALQSGVPTNRISSVTTNGLSSTYTYDSAGNVTADGQHTYQYDGENRLVKVDNGLTGEYSYDHQNRRYKKVAGGSSRVYIWEGNKLIAEHNTANGTVVAEYIFAGTRMISRIASGVTRYFLQDRLSIRATTDASGAIVGRQSHLPFGEAIGSSGDTDKHRFTTYERDAESDSDYAINRQYPQATGRFNRVDPLRSSARRDEPQSWNRYSYSANDPVNLTDPLGLQIGFVGTPSAPPPPGPRISVGNVLLGAINLCAPGVTLDGFEFTRNTCDALSPLTEGFGVGDILDFLADLASGKLTVDNTCQKAIYIPEGNESGKAEKAYKNAVGVKDVPCDFVATPRGAIKIPNGCDCFVKCDSADYLVDCSCKGPRWLIFEPEIMTEANYGKDLANPTELYPWVGSGAPYHRTRGGVTPAPLPPGGSIPFFQRWIFN